MMLERLKELEERDRRARQELANAVMPPIIDKMIAEGVLPPGTKLVDVSLPPEGCGRPQKRCQT